MCVLIIVGVCEVLATHSMPSSPGEILISAKKMCFYFSVLLFRTAPALFSAFPYLSSYHSTIFHQLPCVAPSFSAFYCTAAFIFSLFQTCPLFHWALFLSQTYFTVIVGQIVTLIITAVHSWFEISN